MTKSGYKEGGWRERLTHGAPLAVLIAAGLFIAYRLLFILELIAIAMLIALLLRSIYMKPLYSQTALGPSSRPVARSLLDEPVCYAVVGPGQHALSQ